MNREEIEKRIEHCEMMEQAHREVGNTKSANRFNNKKYKWENIEGYCLYGRNLADTFIPLAMYKTKERALEVLDEIQELLNPLIKVKNEFKKSELTGNCNWEQDIEYINIPTKVYKMPQE